MIPHNRPTFNNDEIKASDKVIRSGWVSQGNEVTLFEKELCNFFNLPEGHALAVSSGSAALYLSLWILGGRNKNIGLPVYACAALRNAIGLIEGNPIYYDCKIGSPNLDISKIDPNDIDILIAPSMFGIPLEIPNVNKYKVIEDIAQSFGAKFNNKRIGLRGDIGICSFYATKMITSGGQGGAIISKDKSIIDKLKDYRQFDCREDTKLRFNFQMTDLQASIGRVQLKKLPNFIEKREKFFSMYQNFGLNLLDSSLKSFYPVRYRAVLITNKQNEIISSLAKKNIHAIIPIEKWELLDDFKKYPIAHKLTNESVSLPIYPSMTVADIKEISKVVSNFLE